MDPLTAVGLVANVAQLISLVATLVQYLNDVKDGPRDRARLAGEAASLLTLLTEFRYGIEGEGPKDPRLSVVRMLAMPGGALDEFHVTVKELLRKLRPCLGSKRIWRVAMWPLSKRDIEGLLSRIERLKSLINLYKQEDHFRLSLKIDDSLTEFKQKLREDQKDRELRDILEWTSSLDFKKKQADYLARSTKGTGEWFLMSDTFRAWIDGPPRTLWCRGQGAGKTILSSIVVNYLEQQLGCNTAVAYIYCDYKEQKSQSAEVLIASLLGQLAKADVESTSILFSQRKLYERKGSRPTLVEWGKMLQNEIRRFSRVFIVIDALDECAEKDGTRSRFMAEIRALQSSVHLLVTSRQISSVENEIGKAVHVDIRASESDVLRYLENRILKENRLACLLRKDQNLRDTILTTIAKSAKGMFLLAQLQMDAVAVKNNRRDIRRALACLPTGLSDIYDEALRRIRSQGEEDVKLAKRLLSWVVCARRLLTVLEVQHALAVEPKDVGLDEDGITEEDILVSSCAGLVTIDGKSKVVRLVHYTAQEYFEQNQPSLLPGAHITIATICLTYLSFDTFDVDDCTAEKLEDLLERYPLVPYAARYWGDHAKDEPRPELDDLATSLLIDKNKVAVSSRIMSRAEYGYTTNLTSIGQGTGLHVAAGFGLAGIVQSLLKTEGIDPNAQDFQGETPLSRAAAGGHEAVVRQLLLHKSTVADARSARGWTPLSLAATNGHVAIVYLLLRGGRVDINAKDPYYGQSALWRAADQGHEDVVKLLLNNSGVDINARDNYRGHTPLWRAADKGHLGTVRLLLAQPEVEINAVDNHFEETPLQRAVARGHTAVVALLLEQSGVNGI
ncbi:hypothetical protein F5Y19DRAFT_312512 [Xylariaceae sp. FL1651]|nr:hypothetical protein F5Y19DRAFT_312512 [Xylariaceae sp. FL1651]